MSTITGSPVYPATFVIPDDGSPRDASSVGVPFEALADRTEWLKAMLGGVESTVFNASGTYEVPSQCRLLVAVGYGGGGAGASGCLGVHPLGQWLVPGGGGGGGATEFGRIIEVTPGETLDVVVGAGGIPGSLGQGSSTQVKRGATVIATFPGGGSGTGGAFDVPDDDFVPFSSGGPSAPQGVPPINAKFRGLVAQVIRANELDLFPQVALPPVLPAGQDRKSVV